jgi:hypothetical protein
MILLIRNIILLDYFMGSNQTNQIIIAIVHFHSLALYNSSYLASMMHMQSHVLQSSYTSTNMIVKAIFATVHTHSHTHLHTNMSLLITTYHTLISLNNTHSFIHSSFHNDRLSIVKSINIRIETYTS